jgi:hypothetical protein
MTELRNWKITWGDNSWTDLDVTGAHLVAVADLLGADDWKSTSPWNGPKALAAWCVIFVSSLYEGDIDKALTVVYSASAEQLLSALSSRD